MGFQPPKGTRDFLPADAKKLQQIIDILRSTFEKFGFEPMSTPAFESFELLSAKGGLGEAVKDEIYYFEDKSKRPLALRFDLTMPLARVATSNNFPLPFKRYQIEKVWRYDNPQALRWREFLQADADIVGSKSILADAECLAAACACIQNLGFKEFYVRVNSRKLLQKLFEKFVEKKKIVDAFRIIDKLEKIGKAQVENELKKKKIDAKKILDIIKISGTNEEILRALGRKFGRNEGLEELESLIEYAKSFGIENLIKIDLSLVRGLEYYTGLVFEISLGAKVSCGGGGRYDNLLKIVGGKDLPATGISLGVDRILEVMKENKMFEEKVGKKVFVANATDDMLNEAIKVARKLREEGVACEINLMERNLAKQLEYADKISIPFVVIVGKEELKQGRYKLRDMQEKTEKILDFREILSVVKGR
jgi:histidyl-tRNA synthetase